MTGELERRCALPSCGKPLVRRPGEWLARFQERPYCDMTCSAAARRHPVESGRVCGYSGCGKPMTRNVGESPAHFAERGMCSPACRHAHRAERAALVRAGNVKPCQRPGCDRPVRQGPRESVFRWQARKSCSVECATEGKRKPAAERAPRAARPRSVKAVPPPSQTPPPQTPAVARTEPVLTWRPSAPGWSLRPGDKGYDEVAS